MADEIERKFLVRGEGWRSGPIIRRSLIRQAYLTQGNRASIRIRIRDADAATLTVKSNETKIRRQEYEYAIPVQDAEAMLALRAGSVIEKVRHDLAWGSLTWEIDVFEGENKGLVIAEIELSHEAQDFMRPDWLGPEITDDPRYSNSSLAIRPFCAW